MPKSKVTKRAKAKKNARRKQKESRVRVQDLADMINILEKYEDDVFEPLLETEDGLYLTPAQAALVEELKAKEAKENKDGG